MEWGHTSTNVIPSELEIEEDWWEAEREFAIRSRRQSLKEVVTLFEQLTMIEVTSLLELGLWKQSSVGSDITTAGRERGRMKCGAEVVIPNVIGFLGSRCEGSLVNVSASRTDCNVSWIGETPSH